MVIPIPIIGTPVVLAIWAADLYILAVAARWFAARLDFVRGSIVERKLGAIVDPMIAAVRRWLERRFRGPCSPGAAYIVAVLALFIVRTVLVGVIGGR